MARENAVVQVAFNETANSILFTVAGAGQTELFMDKLNDAIFNRAATHGLVQRVSDGAAIPKRSGVSATPEEKLARMARIVDHYNSGAVEWDLPRGPHGERIDMFVIWAYAEIKGIDQAAAYKILSDKADEKGMALKDVVKATGAIEVIAAKVIELRKAKASQAEADLVNAMEEELLG